MSKMLAEIRRIVDEDVSSRVTQYDVLYEAIINSIHAGAARINCLLTSLSSNQTGLNAEQPLHKLDSITVTDNGSGFTDENYNSFCKYRTEYKKSIGGKGVGRFVFLKLYDKVRYTSQLAKENQLREFNFDVDFDTDNIQKKKAVVGENLTVLTLNSLSSHFFDDKREIDRRIKLDLNVIREKVLLNLIPTLFFYKKNKKSVIIEFEDFTTKETVTIQKKDVPDFTELDFQVVNRDGRAFDFKLNFLISKEPGTLHAYYCANNRTVCELFEKDLKITLPLGYSGFFLVESKYLDAHVNNSRNDFDIFPVKTDLVSSLSWDMINDALKKKISEIVKSEIPETESINKSKLQDIQEERPYLTSYIEEEDIDMAGYLDKKHIIDKAKKRFDTAKEKLLSNAGKTSYTEEELREAIIITQNELISYINDRVQVIERLKTLIDKRERVESIIHNLFMEKNSTSDYFNVGTNNLWLLDDRFTTYSYAASDKRISTILSTLNESSEGTENGDDKPDLSIFFSNNPTKSNKVKSVLIELKPFDFSAKSDRKKFQGIQQLIDYVKAFKNKEKIEEIFAFLITDIDEKLAERLSGDGYVPLFSTESPIYHRFYDKLGISIYVVSARTLVLDAESRNKVFLDIIKKQSRLHKIFSKS